ncbi:MULTISPECIES: helix-turn-helix domain-containing protein [Oceanobacillus]|uniref:helix-turn-helix domain-containing protein n=1 Tax=Oceanobacillus TaxID=182709 RepID=UPI000944CDAC|nr:MULTISPECIES: helix-turn-helix transcriptional regulator [Oceanobacillus]
MESFKGKKISNISKNIKKYRLKEGFNQKEFADYLRMHYQNYSKLERGVYTPSLEKLLNICDTLHITPNDLLLDVKDDEEYQDEDFVEVDFTILDIKQTMKIVEEIRANAIVARKIGDKEKERMYLDDLIQVFAWKNEDYWDIADFLYKDKLEKYFLSASKKIEKKLVDKQMKEHMK